MVEDGLVARVVDEMVAGLSDGERKGFGKELVDCLYDRSWCAEHGVDYLNPDVGLAKAELYVELYINKSRELP